MTSVHTLVRPPSPLLLVALFLVLAAAPAAGKVPAGCVSGCHIDGGDVSVELSGAGIVSTGMTIGMPADPTGSTVHVAATCAIVAGDGSPTHRSATGTADVERGSDGTLPPAVPVEVSGDCPHGGRLSQTVSVPVGAIASTGASSGSAQALAGGECRCAVGDATPESVTVGPCEGCKHVEASAPLTCDGVSTGRLAGSTNYFVNASARLASDSVPVMLSGYCAHGNYFTKAAGVVVEIDDALPAGGETIGLASVHMVLSLGREPSRKGSGRLVLDAASPSAIVCRQSSLRLVNSRAHDIVETNGVRQILAAQCLAVLSDTGADAFEAAFHDAAAAGDPDSATGLYTPSAPPYAVYRFSKPGGAGTLRIERTGSGVSERTWNYEVSNGALTLAEDDGLRVRSLAETPGADGSVVVRETVSGPGGVASVTERTYREYNGRRHLVREVVDPDGAALATVWERYEAGPLAGAVRRRVGPDGRWTLYGHTSDGLLVEERSGWLSDGENTPCRSTVYGYAPFLAEPLGPEADAPFDNGCTDPDTPRTEVATVGAVPVSATLRHVSLDAMGYRRIEEVRLLDPSCATNPAAAWADPANPRTVSFYMPDSDYRPCSRLPFLVVHPDGTAEQYDYASGAYANNADGTPGAFTPQMGGKTFRVTVTRGTRGSFRLDAYGNTADDWRGIPLRTTREVRYETRIDKLELARETYVCTGADSWERVAWTTTARDGRGRVVATLASDGSRTSQTWSNGLLASRVVADGVRTDFQYDALGRRIISTHTDPLTGAAVVVSNAYDAVGRVLAATTSASTDSPSSASILHSAFSILHSYDLAGRLAWSRGTDGVETAYGYAFDPATGLSATIVTNGFGTALATESATYAYADGRTAFTTFNGVRRTTYDYGVADDGSQWSVAYEGPRGTASPRWTATVSDPLGRTIRELRPGFGGAVLETAHAYDASGRRLATETFAPESGTATAAQLCASASLRENAPILSRELYVYDDLGDLRVTARDIDLDGSLDFAGPDVVVSNATSFAWLDSAWWREERRFAFPDAGSAAPLLVSTLRTRLSGLGGEVATELGAATLTSEVRSSDVLGNTSVRRTYRNRDAHATFTVSASPASALSAWSVAVGGHVVSNRTATGVVSSREYDALGRVVSANDGRGNKTACAYDEFGRLSSITDEAGLRTSCEYDALGRRIGYVREELETGNGQPGTAQRLAVAFDYDAEGRVVAEYGATYPVAYGYDAYGELSSLSTYRDESLASPDTTWWLRDEATGLVTNKVYADGLGPSYAYTADGLLTRRTWARGVATDYAYDALGNLLSADYSDATPDIAYTRDRLGNVLSAVADGISTNLYAYSREGLLTNEVQNGVALSRPHDALGRPTGYACRGADDSSAESGGAGGSPAETVDSISYTYDSLGRLSAVEFGFNAEAQRRRVEYGYLPGTDLVAGYTSGDFARSVSYEPHRDLIASVENAFGETVISRFDYTNDALGRRTAIARSGAAFSSLSGAVDAYGYNVRSEVVSARRTLGGDEVRGFSFDYAYDPIGNRTSSAEYDENGVLRLSLYESNELNEYTRRTVAGHATVLGEADADAEVTVNGRPAWRLGPYFYGGDNVFNATNAVFAELEVEAVRDLGGGTNAVDSAVVRRFVPETPERFAYDADGNMTSDGRWTYTWNGENRLVRAVEAVHPTNRAPRVVEYAYDHRGRMVWKTIGGTNGPPDKALSYTWDDYNIVRETLVTRTSSLVTDNVWGLDLDGTMQGCGGVGGLLAVVKGGEVYTPTYDANGNISEYVCTNGTIIAHQEYDPFGNAVVSAGDADSFTHWFSTKPWCGVTGMVEYQLRKYEPSEGRWMSRDSMEETGGIHLSHSFHNNPVNSFDYLGMSVLSDLGDFLINNRMADYLVCLGNCIEDNDPLSTLAHKLILAIAGMPIPKQLVIQLAKMVGEDRLEHAITVSLAGGDKSPYTVIPQVLAKAIYAHTSDHVFARNLLRTIGKGASVFWHTYGIYMAFIESQCAIKCSACRMYDGNSVPVSIDSLFQLLMNSLTNMYSDGKED